MHLLVLSAFRPKQVFDGDVTGVSQCTFWCSVLSDHALRFTARRDLTVSMHLLVLSAFRPRSSHGWHRLPLGLNAPFGAQCFPTKEFWIVPPSVTVSQCTFWCSVLSDGDGVHSWGHGGGSQCTFWCSVLSDATLSVWGGPASTASQCTFWRSVLSDLDGDVVRLALGRLNAPFGAQCFPTT